MKKLLVILLLAVLTCGFCISGASAEFSTTADFTLHSGVTFGMSREEVKKLEEENGFTVNEGSLTYTYYDSDGSYRGKKTDGFTIYGSMAGISSSTLYYYFDEDGKLFGMVYKFGDHDEASYNDIKELINDKYANSAATDTRKIASITDVFYSDTTNATLAYDMYDSRQIMLQDGSRIQIEHLIFYSNVPGYSKDMNIMFGGKHYLEYRLASSEEMDATEIALGLKQQQEEEQQRREEEERNNQRNNDI